jgi:hypothetical protein
LQIGAEITDFVIILNTDEAVSAFSRGGNVTLGGNLSVAAGPVGRSVEAGGAIAGFAAIYSYSKTKGLFAGVSIEGSVIIERKETNEEFYGKRISAKDILGGKVSPPACADALYDALDMRSGSSNEVYRRGEANRPGSGGGGSSNSLNRDGVRPGDNPGGGMKQGGSSNSLNRNPESGLSRAPPGNPFTKTSPSSGPPAYSPGGNSASTPTRVPPPIPKRLNQNIAVALYDFKADQPGDLGFSKGDVVILEREEGEWWSGSCRGASGVFPSNYVEKKR